MPTISSRAASEAIGSRSASAFGDFNGDGASDYAQMLPGSSTQFTVFLSEGQQQVERGTVDAGGKCGQADNHGCLLFAGTSRATARSDLLMTGLLD